MVEKWQQHEVDAIHRLWEYISTTTNVLDVATCPDERKMLALVLENKRLEFWGTYNQYNRVYLSAVQDLHDKYYLRCMTLVSNIELNKDGIVTA